MPQVTKETLQKLNQHNASVAAKKTGLMKPKEVRDIYEQDLADFAKEVIMTRSGHMEDSHGRKIAPYDIGFSAALQYRYGVADVNQYLRDMGIFVGTDSVYSMGRRLGVDNLTVSNIEALLKDYNNFNTVGTTGFSPELRFLIPEIIMNAIRVDYEADSFHQNWISGTQNIGQRKVTMPHILRGNAVPRRIGEAESIPFGSVRFGQKEASVYKVGVGLKLTDELIEASSISLFTQFLGEVGSDMSIGVDAEALLVLINGEQADSSESAPVVGVTTANTVAWKDIKRVTSRMARLKRPVDRLLTSEDDGITISELEEFRGFDGGTRLANLQTILGVPPTMVNDVFTMPANQMMFLSSGRAMIKLQYGGMKVEDRRNPQNQENELFISDYTGFAIVRRDARVILDKSDTIANLPFPAYMDIDSRINQAFKKITE